jgi:peptide/nickel transport system permease protein
VTRFLADRLLQALAVLAAMSFAVYALIGLMPGDPVDIQIAADPNMTPETAEALRRIYGLDRPILERYLEWLSRALAGEFGHSRLFSQPALDVLVPRVGNTLILLGTALVLAVALAVPLGVVAARGRGGWGDRLIGLGAFAGISVPPFWLALLLILLFAVTLGWLPAGGMHPVGRDGALDRLPYLVMPVAVLTLATVGAHVRYVRAAMIEALRQDWVRTARAKGVPEGRILWRHALRAASAPVVTILALEFGTLFSGALVVETMFAYQGMGKLIYDSVMGNDFNLALIGLLFATAVVLAANLAADVLYAALDPRVSLTGGR